MDPRQLGPQRRGSLPQLLQHLIRCYSFQSPPRPTLALDTTPNSLSLPAARPPAPAKMASPVPAPHCRSPGPTGAAASGRQNICSAARFSPRRRGSKILRDTARSASLLFFLRWLLLRKDSPLLQSRPVSQRWPRTHSPPLPAARNPAATLADSTARKFVMDSTAAEERAACRNVPKRKESATI